MEFGAFVISLDLELSWGVRDSIPSPSPYDERIRGEWTVIPRLLDMFEEFEIPATWCVVGLLFAESRSEQRAYWPVRKPGYADTALSPYSELTGETEKDDPLHFGAGLVRAIASRNGQEIGSHTFSHYYCLEPGQTAAEFQADLEAAQRIAARKGLELRSLIFPRNQVNEEYLGIVSRCGFTCYRGVRQGWMYTARPHRAQQSWVRRIARIANDYVGLVPTATYAWNEIPDGHGLYNVRASHFLRPYSPALAALELRRVARIVQDLELAARQKRVFHLWWHPHNMGIQQEENLATLRRILEASARLRSQYGLRALSMRSVAELCARSTGAQYVAAV